MKEIKRYFDQFFKEIKELFRMINAANAEENMGSVNRERSSSFNQANVEEM